MYAAPSPRTTSRVVLVSAALCASLTPLRLRRGRVSLARWRRRYGVDDFASSLCPAGLEGACVLSFGRAVAAMLTLRRAFSIARALAPVHFLTLLVSVLHVLYMDSLLGGVPLRVPRGRHGPCPTVSLVGRRTLSYRAFPPIRNWLEVMQHLFS